MYQPDYSVVFYHAKESGASSFEQLFLAHQRICCWHSSGR
jgi:hypothetical protein